MQRSEHRKKGNVPELRSFVWKDLHSAAATVVFCCNDFIILLTKYQLLDGIFLFLHTPTEGTQ
jgi:hypothetical protein